MRKLWQRATPTQCSLVGTGAGRYWDCDWHCADCIQHVGIKVTSTTEFCVSCHSMQPVYEEYKQSVHFQNASGVRAECHDCHIPPDIPGMVKRKLEASNDIYQTFIAHSIDTPEEIRSQTRGTCRA